MNVWPFPPQVDIKERFEWMTEVMKCRSAEQRICLRNLPRTVARYKYQLLPQEVEAATVMAREWGSSPFLVPLWPDLAHVGEVLKDSTSLLVDTTVRRFGDKVFIIDQDNRYEVLDILSRTDTSLTLSGTGTTKDYSNAVVTPCYTYRFNKDFDFRKYAADYFTASAEFISTEDQGIAEVNNYPVYGSSYVLSDRPISEGTIKEKHYREFSVFSNISGPLYYSEKFTFPQSDTTISWSFDNLSQVYSFLQWVFGVKGKQQSFYLPRWTRDFIITRDVDPTHEHVVVKSNSFLSDSYQGPVCLVKQDGSQIYLDVVSWAYVGIDEYRMNLSAPVGEGILKEEVEMITRMPLARFNSDVVELNRLPAGVVNVKMPVMEVPDGI